MSPDDDSARLRSAASLLVKGGTLTGEPCPKCGGVQVSIADNMSCINCGHETKIGMSQTRTEKDASAQEFAGLASVPKLIEERIVILAADIRTEIDISAQKQKAELLESYLRILERTRSLLS